MTRQLEDPTRAFKRLSREVTSTRSEPAALNAVVRFLAVNGYPNAGVPEQYDTTYDKSTLRFYVWRDSPFGDDLVLATGPSFTSAVNLGSNIESKPGVGVFIKGILADKKTPQLSRTERVAARAVKPSGRAPRVRRSVVVEEAVQATKTAIRAVEKAEDAAAAVKAAVKSRKPAVVRKKVQEAEVAAEKAEEAAEVAIEAAEVASETVPDDAADAELIKLARILREQLGL